MSTKEELELELSTIETKIDYLKIVYDNFVDQLSIINQQMEMNVRERAYLSEYETSVMNRLNAVDEELNKE